MSISVQACSVQKDVVLDKTETILYAVRVSHLKKLFYS